MSLRRCLSCGHVGCCDSSPNTHATAHHQDTTHPMVQTVQPGQDWAWCYVDEVTVRPIDGRWVEVDLFYEAGVAYMREHVEEGGDPNVDEDFAREKGFPLGRWRAEMRRRRAAGELTEEQSTQIEALPRLALGGLSRAPMAYDEDLADRIRDALADDDAITERKMFGGLAVMLGGNMLCGVIGDGLLVRLGPELGDAALDEPHTRVMDMTGRPMRSMIVVDPPGTATDAQLEAWLARARAFVETLPPKR